MTKKAKGKAGKDAPAAPQLELTNVAALGEILSANGASMGSFGAVVSFFQNAGPGFQMALCELVGGYLMSLTEEDGLKTALSGMLPEDEEPTDEDLVAMSDYLNERAGAVLGLLEPLLEDEEDEDLDGEDLA